MKEVDEFTDHNRLFGINISHPDSRVDALKYPLKLISCSSNHTYESLEGRSYSDPEQGFHETKRDRPLPY